MTTHDGEASGDSHRGESSVVRSEVVDLAALAGAPNAPGAAWTHVSEDLNVNLLVFPADEGVAPHENAEVDVLVIGITGAGVIEVDGVSHALRSGLALVIPRGARRGTRALSDHFAYLTCHRRRAGLWPRRNPRPNTGSMGGVASGG